MEGGDGVEDNHQLVDKVLEIPVINSAAVTLKKVYVGVKNLNGFTHFGLSVAENGIGIVASTATTVSKPLQGTFNLAGDTLCIMVDELKYKVPIVNRTPTEWKESGKQMILRSFVAQKVFGVLHFGCTFSEAVLNMIPEVAAEEEGPTAVAPVTWKHRYYVVTKPVKVVKVYLRQFRKRLRYLRQNYRYRKSNRNSLTPDLAEKIKARKKMSPRKRIPEKGWFSYLMSVPNKAMNMLGVLAYEHSKFNIDRDVLVVDKSPIHEVHNSEERKRKTYEVDSDGSDELNLNNLDEDYNSEDDPDYQPSRSGTSESLEYTSDTDDLENSSVKSQENSPDKPAAPSSDTQRNTTTAPSSDTQGNTTTAPSSDTKQKATAPSTNEQEKRPVEPKETEVHSSEEESISCKSDGDQSETTTSTDQVHSSSEDRPASKPKETSASSAKEPATSSENLKEQNSDVAKDDVTYETRDTSEAGDSDVRESSQATGDESTAVLSSTESSASVSNGVEDVEEKDSQVSHNTAERTEMNGADVHSKQTSANQGKRKKKQGKGQRQAVNEVNGV